MLENISNEEALLIIKRSNTAHEDIFTIRRMHVFLFGEYSTPAVLSRIIYWTGKSSLSEGWFYKTAEEMGKETCLSRSTVMRIKEKLELSGIIETATKKIDGIPTLHWKLIPKALLTLEINYMNSDCVNLIQSDCVTVEQSYNKQTTTLSTIDISKERNTKERKPSLPDWMPVEAWNAYCEMRKKLGAFTEYAKKLKIGDLQKMAEEGGNVEEIINQSIANSWKGFFHVKKGGDSDRGNRKANVRSDGNRVGATVTKSTKYANVHQESLE